jgi:hypothetical protein
MRIVCDGGAPYSIRQPDIPDVLLRYDPKVPIGQDARWRKISASLPELEARLSAHSQAPYLLSYPDSLKKKHTYFIKIIDVCTIYRSACIFFVENYFKCFHK